MTIRPAAAADRDALAALAGQLGYPSTPAAIGARWEALARLPDHAVLVAEAGGRVVGWVHVGRRILLVSDPVVEVLGLVVDEACRGRGLGRALLAAAEAWARGRGESRVVLRSNVKREAAHAFYLGTGYTHEKSQKVFGKELP